MPFKTERDVTRLKLPDGRADAFHFDELVRGLSVRLQGARKTWVVHYSTAGGKRRRLSLGDVAGLSLSDARKRAGEIVASARTGADPLASKTQARADAERTFAKVADLFLAARQKADPTGSKRLRKPLRAKSFKEIERTLAKHAKTLRDRPLDKIHASDLKALVAKVANNSGPVAASRVRAHLSSCWSWAIEKGFAAGNPVAELPGGDAAESRDRVLDHREIAAIWRAAGDADGYGSIIKLLFLTGCRRGEVGGMEWPELDLEAATWRVPAARMKNGRPHTVFLTPRAVAVLRRQPRRGEHVFGRRSGFQGWSQCKRRLDARSGVAGWTVHDIRRTVATELQRLGVRLEVAERILAHAATAGSRAGVTGIYQRHSFDNEARDALHRWADRLLEIVGEKEPGNVVALRA
jgi:integrase